MSRARILAAVGTVGAWGAMLGCSSSSGSTGPMTDAQYATSVTQGMHDSMQADLDILVQATTALQQAVPDHPWDNTDPQWPAMQTQWIAAREAYERIEGATAPVFPNVDLSIDGRVEDFGPAPGSGVLTATSDMFGDQGMTGLHAIERIMYVATTPASVMAYEKGLGYVPPQSFPTTQAQADEFKNVLCARAVSDAMYLQQNWVPAQIDPKSAFDGLISLMNEQKEKVTLAGLDQEESRYSQRTLDDLRENLLGTTKIYAIFQPWITSKTGGAAVDAQVEAGFSTLTTLYNSAAYAGVALPTPPADWSDTNPSSADLATTFGALFAAVQAAVNPMTPTSVVSEMNDAAVLCGIPPFME
jgi:iron uptake system component EfeO